MSLDRTSIERLKRRLASLKGWLTRRKVTILSAPQSDSLSVEYKRQFWRSTAWFVSPGGRDDAELVQKFMETKAKLEELGAS